MERVELPPDTLRAISDDPGLSERYRQVTVNHQVADLLDVRALRAGTATEAGSWRRRASLRRAQGDRLLQELLDEVEKTRLPR